MAKEWTGSLGSQNQSENGHGARTPAPTRCGWATPPKIDICYSIFCELSFDAFFEFGGFAQGLQILQVLSIPEPVQPLFLVHSENLTKTQS